MNKKLVSIFLMIAMLLSLESVSVFAQANNEENTTITLEQNKENTYTISFNKTKFKNAVIVSVAIVGAYIAGYSVAYVNQPTIGKMYKVISRATLTDLIYFTLWGTKYVACELADGIVCGAKEVANCLGKTVQYINIFKIAS